MAYIYQVTFDIPYEDQSQLRIGDSIQVALAYLRALLPSEPGYVSSRAMFSLSHDELTHIVFESMWDDWDSFQRHHSRSPLDEDQLLNEFRLDIKPRNLATHVYQEVG